MRSDQLFLQIRVYFSKSNIFSIFFNKHLLEIIKKLKKIESILDFEKSSKFQMQNYSEIELLIDSYTL
jgi:hypothetical protein